MNVFKLTREGGTEVIAQACGACGRVYDLADAYAERCCNPRCADCGVSLPLKGAWVACEPCRAKRDAAREQERREKAIRVPVAEYDEAMVYVDGGWNDGFMSLADVDDWAADMGIDYPAEVWACSSRLLQAPSAESICEDMAADTYDGAEDDVVGLDELDAAICAFNAKQTARVYEPDYSRLVVTEPQPATP